MDTKEAMQGQYYVIRMDSCSRCEGSGRVDVPQTKYSMKMPCGRCEGSGLEEIAVELPAALATLESDLRQAKAELETERQLRVELKEIANIGVSEMSAFADVIIEEKRIVKAELEQTRAESDRLRTSLARLTDENERLKQKIKSFQILMPGLLCECGHNGLRHFRSHGRDVCEDCSCTDYEAAIIAASGKDEK